jgi:predicted DNA-binding transcriptional regulator AlpA
VQPDRDPEPAGVPSGALNREELAARLGVAPSTLYRWQANDDLGFPAADATGRWDPAPVERWHSEFVQTKRAKLRPVDRNGDPDELLDTTEVGRVLGYQGADPGATIRSYRQPRHGNYFPDPDGTLTNATGREVPAWRRDTIWAFADNRDHHGGGTPGRSGRPRSTAAPYSTDPALPAVQALLKANPNITGPALADATGLSVPKAYRLLKATKALPTTTSDPAGHHAANSDRG